MPEDFEFPACSACNNGTSKHDTIFAFCSLSMDFNEANQTPADLRRLRQHRDQIAQYWPEALPDFTKAQEIFRADHIITPSPVAMHVETTAAMKEALDVVGEKLAHALYYREMKRIMQPSNRFFTVTAQIQNLEQKPSRNTSKESYPT